MLHRLGARLTRITMYRLIQQEVPDYLERMFYVSGPEPMVAAMEKTLSDMGIAKSNIKKDFFQGYQEA